MKAGSALVRITNILKCLTPEEVGWVMSSLSGGSLVGASVVQMHRNAPVHAPENTGANGAQSTLREGGLGGGFERFWSLYPNKKGKLEARKSYEKLKPTPELQETLVQAVHRQVQWESWTRDSGRFIPMGKTWINQQRWTDEPTRAPVLPKKPLFPTREA